MIIIGVDPGVRGSLAAIESEGPKLLATLDMPVLDLGTKTRRCVDVVAIADWVSELVGDGFQPEMLVIEHQQSMTGDFINTVFMQGLMFGGILTALMTLGLPVHFTTPLQWKTKAGLVKKDKKASLARGRQLFGQHPDLKRIKDETRAEAALIAFYGPPERSLPKGKRAKVGPAPGADLFGGVA